VKLGEDKVYMAGAIPLLFVLFCKVASNYILFLNTYINLKSRSQPNQITKYAYSKEFQNIKIIYKQLLLLYR